GTSCDIALIADGKPLVRSEGQIDGYPVRVPMVDVNAIGAGGGSIAWLDGAGGLRVGPQSAGADPGPAAYAKGATQATVTDASLVLGLLNANNFAGGTMALDANKARAAIHETIAQPLGMTVEAAAQGIRQVINAQMAEGMRMVSIRQGYDPRDFALVALGGAGPVHALALAEELSISTVIVPRHPGVLSAEGLLMAPLEHSVAAGFPRKLSETCATEVRERLAQLDERAAALMVAEGLVDGAPDIQHFADVCYVGQSHYLEVALEPDSAEPLNAVYQAFIATHERVFGYATASPAQLVNLRSVHRSPVQKREDATPVAIRSAQTPEIRAVALDAAGHFQDVPIYQRDTLTPGQVFEGPAIIEQPDTTTVVHTGWQVTVLANGHLKLEQHKTL
ncbi:MAG: hydantoinase/oxoprolinase family protein, partial [Chromatiales bacterium]|nr:hydantoinase/oxoprolinase family protein [Chromatiales bacterium]